MFGKRGAPMGNKNAKGHHRGHFNSGALKKVAKVTAISAAAVGAGVIYAESVKSAYKVGLDTGFKGGMNPLPSRPARSDGTPAVSSREWATKESASLHAEASKTLFPKLINAYGRSRGYKNIW